MSNHKQRCFFALFLALLWCYFLAITFVAGVQDEEYARSSEEIFRYIRRQDAKNGQIFNNIKGSKKSKQKTPVVKSQDQGKKQILPLLSEVINFENFDQDYDTSELLQRRFDPKKLVSQPGVIFMKDLVPPISNGEKIEITQNKNVVVKPKIYTKAVQDRIKIFENEARLLRQKQAFLDQEPLDSYMNYTLQQMDFRCQNWPNDYGFVQQMLFMSEKLTSQKDSIFNSILVIILVTVFFVNGSIFREFKLMYTINLFVTLIICLYIGKFFDNDGISTVASFMKIVFFVMSHHFIDQLIICFKIQESNYPLLLPDIKKEAQITYILSKQALKKEQNIVYSIEISGLSKKKPKNTKKIPHEFEGLRIMNKQSIYWFEMCVFRRFFISWMEYVLASVNSLGSQSDFVQLFMQAYTGQCIFRFFQILEMYQIPIFNLQSTSIMIFFVQIAYMLSTHVYFHFEKLQLEENYNGELCNLMVFYEKQRCFFIISYIFAVFIKVYNNWYFQNLKMHVLGKQMEISVQEVIKLSYYKFYTRKMRESESSQTFYNLWRQFRKNTGFCHDQIKFTEQPNYVFLIKLNYLLAIVVLFQTAVEHKDFQLKNMIAICLFDLFCEFFDLFPNWERRRMLILDDFLRFLYGENELWNERLYNFAFRKDKFKKSVKVEEYNYELYLTKMAYEEQYIQNELEAIQNKRTAGLRTLAQNEMIIQSDKNLLPYFYAIKISLMIYWLIGQDFVLAFIYRSYASCLWTIMDNINYALYQVKNIPLCARTGQCPFDHLEVLLAYEKLPDLGHHVVFLSIFVFFIALPYLVRKLFELFEYPQKNKKELEAIGDTMYEESEESSSDENK